jgi:proteasome lid subunit RPN8/RPN11
MKIKVKQVEEVQPKIRKCLFDSPNFYNITLFHQESDFLIFLAKNVYEGIYTYAKANNVEVGGVLIGEYCQDNKHREFIIIEDFIPAKTESASAFHVEFDEKTWERIDNIFQKKFKTKKILGWFHSHPGLGVFLSDSDLFIQEHFFSLPWQVVYVVDPIRNEANFFRWYERRIQQITSFYIYSKTKKSKKLKAKLSNFKMWQPLF